MLARCILAAALFTLSARASDIFLSRIGDAWLFFPGPNASLSPEAWLAVSFDDATWSSGRSGFSIGYSPSEATELPIVTTNYTAVLFRRAFLVSNPADVKWLTLRIDYSDGFVAYLNGQEIARRNLQSAAGPVVPWTELAVLSRLRSQPEEIDVTNARAALVTGTNVLAVQVHSASTNSSVLAFSAELLANFNRAPYIQNLSSNRVQIVWKTPVPSSSELEYGPPDGLLTTLLDTNLVTTHVSTLTDLEADSTYVYQARSADALGQSAEAPPGTFHTFKPAGSLSFVAIGDLGWNCLPQYGLADVIRTSRVDFVMTVGDNVYPSFTAQLVDLRCFSVYQPHMANTPYFFTLGNHDLLSGVWNYLDAFYLPTNSVPAAVHALAQTSPEHYYSFDQGDAHFTVLYVPFISQYKLTVGDPQYNWLVQDLASTQQPWKIVIWHVPMNSSSAHRLDDTDFDGVPDRLEVRQVLLPVLSQFGVQLALCGHEHGYERFNPTNGVHAITTAGGGGTLYPMSQLDVASAFFWSRYNCVRVSINSDRLEAEALSETGEVFDRMTIQRRLPAARIYQATWHSPLIEITPANDGEGNIRGQVFDLAGQPIPTLAGQFSNLGRAFVNNDATNLYIGLDRVMIYGDNNIFLFVESPRLAGVSTCANLGNGLVDPDGQGADGLDFLSNLSFANFTPSVGCILGDQFGDGQFRSFARTNLGLNIGQGVFRLDSNLSDIAGIRLQQFHMSPESGSNSGDPNANFIELAIPFDQLGGIKAGDVIRLGAIVGGSQFDLNAQTRLLDSGFLGNALLGSGTNQAVLEGVQVVLAYDPASDHDGDGLPDRWEIAQHLDPLSAAGMDGADGDPDRDGMTNLQEFLSGTDPHDPASALRLSCQTQAGPRNRFTWNAAAGKTYQLQFGRGSPLEYSDVAGALFPASQNATQLTYDLDLRSTGGSAQFFRLRVVP